MKFLLWEKRLETGVEEIDEHHQREIDKINKLHRYVVEENPREQIENCMTVLIDEVRAHFEHEEALMERHNYTGLQAHKDEHREMLNRLTGYFEKFQQGGQSSAYEFLEYVHSWFIHHLKDQDREMGEFLASLEAG